MYREERWDAEKRLLWIKSTPRGEWRQATSGETIDYLAERVAFLESLAAEPAT